MQTAVDYDTILQKAYQISMYYVKEDDTAKDIAQATAIKYFLNVDKIKNETIDRRGYRLRAPCQDILGFLASYAPSSSNERHILDYMYAKNKHHQFVIQNQIMNEGWAMYWEQKIMMKMFKKNVVKGVIDYCRVFSGVCSSRPFFMRNPYHLGYNMWKHIEELYSKGKVSLEYIEEKDADKKEKWDKGEGIDPIKKMEGLVRTITDCEFIRRFLTYDLIEELHLNRVSIEIFVMLHLDETLIEKSDDQFVWVSPKSVKEYMLEFFVDFGRPSVYIIDSDFMDGGLLLYHKFEGRGLREDWIGGALKNMNHIWKAPVHIVTGKTLYSFSDGKMSEKRIDITEFDEVKYRLADDKKPIEL